MRPPLPSATVESPLAAGRRDNLVFQVKLTLSAKSLSTIKRSPSVELLSLHRKRVAFRQTATGTSTQVRKGIGTVMSVFDGNQTTDRAARTEANFVRN